MKKILTTSEVAKMTGASVQTVAKWFNSGRLKGYRLPGSLHRRFLVDDVKEFMTRHNIPESTSQ